MKGCILIKKEKESEKEENYAEFIYSRNLEMLLDTKLIFLNQPYLHTDYHSNDI